MYVLDRQYFQRVWTWVCNMGRKQPLESPKGLVYGQRTGRKFLVATIVSTIQSFGLFFFTGFHSNPFVELVLWFWEIPAMVLGLAAGYWVWPWWERRHGLYKAMDKLDDAIEEHDRAKASKKVEPISDHPTNPAPQQTLVPPPKAEPEMSPQERIRRFTNRG